jgi:hypothetical protein
VINEWTGSLIDPEQAAFRQSLRARTRPPAPEPDDDDWTPHRRWDSPAEKVRRKSGPPQMENPSPQALAVRRYRERVKQRKLDA